MSGANQRGSGGEGVRRNPTDVPTKDVFDLFLLEATFNNQTARSVHRPGCTHFCKHELDDVLRLPVHSFTDIGNVGEDRFLVSFSHDLRRSNGVAFGAGGEKGGIRGMKLSVETLKKLPVRISTTECEDIS